MFENFRSEYSYRHKKFWAIFHTSYEVQRGYESIPIGIKSFGQFFIPPMKFRGGMKEFL